MSDATRNAKLSNMEAAIARIEESLKTLTAKVENNAVDINNLIDSKLTVFSGKLSADIESKMNVLKTDIKEEVSAQIQLSTSKIDAATASVSRVESRLNSLEDRFEASSKENDLIVKGVPIVSNENCSNIYKQIAASIGILADETPIVAAFRLGKKKADSDRDPPILLKFGNNNDKNRFFQKYFDFKNLKLTHIGINGDQRIVITENLTRNNQKIFQAAIKLKFDRKLFQVSTNRGTVFIKRGQSSRRIPVRALSDLDDF